MTREYPKKHNNDHPAAGLTAPPREPTVSELHEAEIEQAKTDIAALVEKARRVEYDRENPNASRPEIEFINELQDIFRQVHKLNAKWLAGPGYEYEQPPYVEPPVAAPVEPAPEAAPI
jgi:hypothetical protein